MSFLV